MADEKVTFEISADTKEAQKELEALQKDLKDVVNITDETQKKLDALHSQRGVKTQREALKSQLNDLKDYREEIEANIKVAKKRVATELSVDKAMARMEKRQQEEKFEFKQPDPVVVRKKDQTSERAKELQDAFARGFNSVAEKRAADENQRILDIIRQRNEAEQEAALLAQRTQEAYAQRFGYNNVPKSAEESASVFEEAFRQQEERMQLLSRIADGAKEVAGVIGGAVVGSLRKLGAVVGNVAKKAVELGKALLLKGAKKAVTSLISPFQKIGKSFSNFGKMLKRAVVFGLIFRPIRQAMSSLTQSLGQALIANNAFNASWANLKGTMLTAVTPAFNALIPVIVTLMNYIAKFITYIFTLINMFLGLKNASKKSAKALSDSAKKGKEASSFASWDTIQQLSKGSGDEGTEPSFDQDWTEAENSLSKIRDLIEHGDWFGVGMEISAKLNDIISEIDEWILGKFAPFMHQAALNMGNLIDGLVEGWDASLTGKTIADGLNVIVDSFATFFETFNGFNLGQKFGEMVNAIFSTFDFVRLAQGLSEWAKDLLDMLIGFLDKTDWQQIGNKVAEFVGNIDWSGIVEKLAFGLGTILTSIAELIYGLVEDAINKAKEWWQKNVTDAGLSIGEGILLGIWTALSNIVTWVKEHIFDPFIAAVKSTFGIHSPAKETQTLGGYIAEGLLEGIKNKLTGIAGWIKTNVFQPIYNAITGAFGIARGVSSKLKEVGKSLSQGIANGISEKISSIKNALNNVISAVERFINRVINGINRLLSGLNSVIGTIGKVIGLENPVSFRIQPVSLPRLAQGTVVNPNHEFAAILGDNRYEQEVVSPLSTMKEAMMEAIRDSGMINKGDIVLQVDGNTFARLINPYTVNNDRRVGIVTGGRL